MPTATTRTRTRRPEGTSEGGQFAPETKTDADPDVTLGAIDDISDDDARFLMKVTSQKAGSAARKYEVDVDDVVSATLLAVVRRHRLSPGSVRWNDRNEMAGYVTQIAHNEAYRLAGKRDERTQVVSGVRKAEARLGRSLDDSERSAVAIHASTSIRAMYLDGFVDPEPLAPTSAPVHTADDERRLRDAEGVMQQSDDAETPSEARAIRQRSVWDAYSSFKGCAPAQADSISEDVATRLRRRVRLSGGVYAVCHAWRKETLDPKVERDFFRPFGDLSFSEQEKLVFALEDLSRDQADAAWDSAVTIATVRRVR
jgi:hypothetical protein